VGADVVVVGGRLRDGVGLAAGVLDGFGALAAGLVAAGTVAPGGLVEAGVEAAGLPHPARKRAANSNRDPKIISVLFMVVPQCLTK
jgi:hypothetical protein